MTPQQVQCIQTYPVHTCDHISQQINSLADSTQQQILYTNEVDASLFTTDTATQCAFNIIPSNLDTESPNDVHSHSYNNTGIHFYSKHKYRDTFGDAHTQYLQTWILKLCHMPCTLMVRQVQLLKFTTFHTKLYSTMIKVCSSSING